MHCDQATSSVLSVLFLTELLEQILLHCALSEDTWITHLGEIGAMNPPKTKLRDYGTGIAFLLISGCRVNKFWRATIQGSPQLQEAMFFKSRSISVGLTLNPLMGRIIRAVTSVQEDDEAFQSWHKMLVVHTSKSQVVLQAEEHGYGGYYCIVNVTFAGNVCMNTFVTWISKPAFALSCREVDGYKAPVMILKTDNCIKRGIGEISYKSSDTGLSSLRIMFRH
jgi:hypothetical protein